MKRIVLFSALVFLFALAGCGGGGGGSSSGGGSVTPGGGTSSSSDASHGTAGCASGNAVFTTTPLALSSVIGWEPLGATEPPGHTFPTDHQYLYFNNPNSMAPLTVNVVAPSDLRIWMLYQNTGVQNSYDIWIQPCAQIIGRLGSITALSPDLAAAAGPINQNCSTSGGSTMCSVTLTYDVKAGQLIGTISAPAENALDWWLWDNRTSGYFIDPMFATHFIQNGISEANIVGASAYFTAAVTPQIDAKLGLYDGSVQRTAPPVDGTISVDVAGTARGYWNNPSQGWPPEDYHAALVPDEVTPTTTEVLSLGITQSNVGSLKGTFSPVTTGLIDRAFESITPDGNIYCYQPIVENTANQNGMIILQLVDANTLKIEIQAKTGGNCAASQPWAFTANAVTYKR